MGRSARAGVGGGEGRYTRSCGFAGKRRCRGSRGGDSEGRESVRERGTMGALSEPRSVARQTGALTVREGEDRPA